MEALEITRINPPKRLRVSEAASYATVSEITIRRALNSGSLKSARLGRRHVIKLADLDDWLDRHVSDYASNASVLRTSTGKGKSS